MSDDTQKPLRGFAKLSPEQRREIATKGGQAAQRKGTGHRWDRTSAAAAGRIGGARSRGGRGKLTT